jgi:hypothetical protein
MAQPERMDDAGLREPVEALRDDSILKPGQQQAPPHVEHGPVIVPAGAFQDENRGGWALVGLYSLTLFLSALLLFSVQPIFAKMLLPLLGGAPAVWNTAMLFYQAALLAGYAYAHWASKRLSPKAHLLSHLALLALPALFLPFAVPKGSEPVGGANPVPWLLTAMVFGIGAPFFVVSTTGPLLQRWFSWSGHRSSADPYFLYAASNLGSMLGLLGYPFLVEPNFRLAEQSRFWAYGYGALAAVIVLCALTLRRTAWLRGQVHGEEAARDDAPAPSWGRRFRWIALAMAPSSLMLGVTQYITTDVAAVPLLWVVPLALYLLTFTIVFARRPLIPHRATLVLMPVAVAALVAIMVLNMVKPLLPVVGVHLAAFFFAAMLCHGELAKDRPHVKFLTEFYLWMSVGGVLGGVFNALVAPVAFPLVLEYPLALAAAAALYPGAWRGTAKNWILDFVAPLAVAGSLVGLVLLEKKYGMTSSAQARLMLILAATLCCLLLLKRPLRFGLGVAAMLAVGLYFWSEPRQILHVERSFFGVTRVELSGYGAFVDLYHGTTMHGMQLTDPKNKLKPVSYYFPSGPIGGILTHMDRPAKGNYAVVGLGSGSLAAYGRKGEKWTYYEIDPVVEKVARNTRYFTFLSGSKADVRVVLGDARISLKNASEKYDLLMLDAYSSDAVPIHLLTKEALDVYLSRLKPGGMIAFHVSNKHLDLEPVVHELCRAAGLKSMVFEDSLIQPEERKYRKAKSDWILAYRPGKNVANILSHGNWVPTRGNPQVGLWTDDFSSIWKVYSTSGSKRVD